MGLEMGLEARTGSGGSSGPGCCQAANLCADPPLSSHTQVIKKNGGRPHMHCLKTAARGNPNPNPNPNPDPYPNPNPNSVLSHTQVIEKNGGCPHMHCVKTAAGVCGANFCWTRGTLYPCKCGR